MINKDFFDSIDAQEKAYWFGFFYADGSLWKNEKQLSIMISSRDINHLQKIADIFDRTIKVDDTFDKRTGKTYGQARLLISCKHMWTQLNQKGIPQRKSQAQTDEVLNFIPEELLSHFIRGYFDGDGHIGVVNETEWRFILVGSHTFLESVQSILCEELHLRKTKITYNTDISRIGWGGVLQLNKIRSWLYRDATVYLERKKDLFDKLPRQRGVSRFQGVSKTHDKKRWVARLYYEGKTRHIGVFATEIEAAKAYNAVAIQQYGAKAVLNFIDVAETNN